MRIPTTDLPSIIAKDLNLTRKQVHATIKLLDDGATPEITLFTLTKTL